MSHLVRFFDIDGTILKQEYVTTGADATAPTTPNYDPKYLVFAEWNQAFTNVQRDLDVGAMYDTINGKTYIFVRITPRSEPLPVLNLEKSGSSLLTVDWGDGTISTRTSGGRFTLQKPSEYPAFGDYIITIDSQNAYGNRFGEQLFISSSSNISQAFASSVLKIYMGINFTIVSLTIFRFCRAMSIISFNKNAGSGWNRRGFEGCHSLKHLNAPTGSSLAGESLNNCRSLKNISRTDNVLTLGSEGDFRSCFNLRKITPTNTITITGTGSYFQSCSNLTGDIVLTSGTTIVPGSTFNGCSSLESVTMLGNITSVGGSAFRDCYSLRELEFPASLTSIGAQAFFNCVSILEYTFLSTTPPSLANTNAFSGINAACKIYVPDANVNDYKTATNWSTYANYIYPLSTKP